MAANGCAWLEVPCERPMAALGLPLALEIGGITVLEVRLEPELFQGNCEPVGKSCPSVRARVLRLDYVVWPSWTVEWGEPQSIFQRHITRHWFCFLFGRSCAPRRRLPLQKCNLYVHEAIIHRLDSFAVLLEVRTQLPCPET